MGKIRLVALPDAPAIRSIYAPAVTREDVATSFETEVPSIAEIENRIRKKLERFPWLVMEDKGSVVGYAYADPHRERAAYQWNAEVSVYVDAGHHRRGVGRELYTALFAMLKHQGIVNVYAGITLPNGGSVALHESMGFALVSIYRSVGFKFGRPHDVAWWHLALQPWPAAPAPIRHLAAAPVSSG